MFPENGYAVRRIMLSVSGILEDYSRIFGVYTNYLAHWDCINAALLFDKFTSDGLSMRS